MCLPTAVRHRLPTGAAFLAVLALVAVSHAQPANRSASGASAPLDRRARAEIIDGVCAELQRTYVEADTARLIAEVLRKRLGAGAYDQIADRNAFAQAVTTDLRSLNGDLHLSLRPAGAGGRREGRPVIVHGGPGGAQPGGFGPGPGVGRGPGNDPGPRRIPGMPDARSRNYGLERVEILAGNVGYLEITGFLGAPGVEDAVVSALRFLERTDAVIIDVRRNGGGSGGMSHLVFSHFLPADSIPTIRVTSRRTAEPMLMRSLVEVPGPRRPEVPLYVLTSRRTGSAAEEFSFVLHNLGRATIVGERSAGAGHMVDFVDVPRDFVLGVSITRVADPRTGREWEAVGVPVDLPVEADRALSAAHRAALQTLADRATEPESKERLRWAADWVSAREPSPPADEGLAAFAGSYEDDREVVLRDGRLLYRRGTLSEAMLPLGERRFMIAPDIRVVFDPGSPAAGFTIERLDGSSTTVARRGAASGGH